MFNKNKKSLDKSPECKNSGDIKKVIPFFAAVFILTVVAFIMPLRPSYSAIDRRELTAFPDFSIEALLSGEYFDGIATWFSDSFPGRDSWLRLSMGISGLHGYSAIALAGDPASAGSTEIPDAPSSLPSPSPTPNEPEEDGEIIPAETPPQGWGGIDVGENAVIDLNTVIQIDDSAFIRVGFSQGHSERYANALNGFAARLEGTGRRVVSALVPTAIGVLLEGETLDMLNVARQDDMINFMHGCMSDSIIKPDIFSALVEHNSEYIYFRTDHHWTALGAYYAYETIMEALDMEAAPLDSFEIMDQGEFEGSLYWQVKYPGKLSLDNVFAYLPAGDITMTAHDNSDYGEEMPLISDRSSDYIYNKYLCFLGGDYALNVITNNSIPDAPSCVVLKGSFGNCFAPFLTQNYHKVYVVDYRRYYRYQMEDFMELYDVDDIIILPYVLAPQGDSVSMFEYLLG